MRIFSGAAIALTLVSLSSTAMAENPLDIFDSLLTPGVTGNAGIYSSTGGLKWAHNASGYSPILGKKTSELNWENMDAHRLYYGLRFDWPSKHFLSVQYGDSSISNGNIIDDDYFSEEYARDNRLPARFSRTDSEVKAGGSSQLGLKFGQTFDLSANWVDKVDLFVDIQYIQEEYHAYGVDLLEFPYADDMKLGMIVPSNVQVLSHETEVKMLGVGVEAVFPIAFGLSLKPIFTYYPKVNIESFDTHHLRLDEFISPTKLSTEGEGYHYGAEILYPVDEQVTISLGYEATVLPTSTGSITSYFEDETLQFPLVHQNYERSGLTLNFEYVFK